MMGNVELYHQYRWRELARISCGRPADEPVAASGATSPVQAFGLALIRIGERLAGLAGGSATAQH